MAPTGETAPRWSIGMRGCPGQQPGYELEVFNAVGDTVAVVGVSESQVEAPRNEERLCVRDTATVAG